MQINRRKRSFYFSIFFFMIALFIAFSANAEFKVQSTDPRECDECYVPAPVNQLTHGEPNLPLPNFERPYIRGRVSLTTLVLSKFNSSSLGRFSAGVLTKNRISANHPGLELAIGYIFEPNFRIDLEYLAVWNLRYTASPVFGNINPPLAIDSLIKNNSMLLNGYIEMGSLYKIRPYAVFGIGAAQNSVYVSLSPVPSGVTTGVTRLVSFIYAGGVGLRVEFSKHWSVDACFRGFQLGLARFKPNENVRLQANVTMSAFGLGLLYAF